MITIGAIMIVSLWGGAYSVGMVDSLTSVQTAAQAQTLANFASVNGLDYASLLPNFVSSGLLNAGTVATQASVENEFVSTPESLLNLDSPTLSLFNEVGADPRSPTITGHLTTQQMQEINILQHDVLALEQAANANDALPLGVDAATVDLSVAAQSLINIVNSVFPPNALAATTPLTQQQLAQIGAILAPLANQPLTPNLVQQIQSQLATQLNVDQNNFQFNLNTVFLVMNYIAAMQPASAQAMTADKDTRNTNDETVAAISAIDAVATEDLAILA